MSEVYLNYDRKFDVLYARLSNYLPSYGDENDGIVTLYSIETDKITGMIIYDVKKRIQAGKIDVKFLPIPLDLNSAPVHSLLSRPQDGYKCTLQLT